MWLALATVIVCGIDGLKRSLKLPAPVDGKDPATMSESDRRSKHIHLLPHNFASRKVYLLGGTVVQSQKTGQFEQPQQASNVPSDVGKPIRDFLGQQAMESYVASQEADHQLFE